MKKEFWIIIGCVCVFVVCFIIFDFPNLRMIYFGWKTEMDKQPDGCVGMSKAHNTEEYSQNKDTLQKIVDKSIENYVVQPFVKVIGAGAFANCYKLEEVEIPPSVVEICDTAFFKCINLNILRLKNGLKTIGKDAFLGCKSLKRLELPNSLENIINNPFGKNTKIKSNGSYYCVVDDDFLIDKRTKELICYFGKDKKIILPNELRVIGDYSFQNNETLKEVVISDNIDKIGNYVFFNCPNLEKVFLPKSIKTIGCNPFRLSNKVKVELHASNNRFLSKNELLVDLSDLTLVCYLGNKDTLDLRKKAFGGLLVNDIRKIGDLACANKPSLKVVILPDGLCNVGINPFEECVNLDKIVVNENQKQKVAKLFMGINTNKLTTKI